MIKKLANCKLSVSHGRLSRGSRPYHRLRGVPDYRDPLEKTLSVSRKEDHGKEISKMALVRYFYLKKKKREREESEVLTGLTGRELRGDRARSTSSVFRNLSVSRCVYPMGLVDLTLRYFTLACFNRVVGDERYN